MKNDEPRRHEEHEDTKKTVTRISLRAA